MKTRDILIAVEETGRLPGLGPLTRYRLKISGLVVVRAGGRAELTAAGVAEILPRLRSSGAVRTTGVPASVDGRR